MKKEIWNSGARSDIAFYVDSEDGDTREFVEWYVICEDEKGNRYRSVKTFGGWNGMEECKAYLVLVNKYLAKGASPARSEKWILTYPAYGSAAYSGADEKAWEKARRLKTARERRGRNPSLRKSGSLFRITKQGDLPK